MGFSEMIFDLFWIEKSQFDNLKISQYEDLIITVVRGNK